MVGVHFYSFKLFTLMQPLFSDEQIITKSDSDIVVLTSHRIFKEEKDFGASYNQSIMLEHITSCENKYVTQMWLLILGILLTLVTIFCAGNEENQRYLIPAAFFALLCFGL